MNHDLVMELDDGLKRHQLRNIPSVDSAMIATPNHSSEHLPEPDVLEVDQQVSTQGVTVKSPPRARTRLERLTEKHTPQRPNWAMADDKPSAPRSGETAKIGRQLRRVPNTVLRVGPLNTAFLPSEQIKALQVRASGQKHCPLSHIPARSNCALAENLTAVNPKSHPSSGEEQRSHLSQSVHPSTGQGHTHPSRAGQISQRYRPITSQEQINRAPVDSGWGQRRRQGASMQKSPPRQPHRLRPEISLGIDHNAGTEYNTKGDSMQWSPKRSVELRRVASSPSKHDQSIVSSNSIHLETQKYYGTTGFEYERGTIKDNTFTTPQLIQPRFGVGLSSSHEWEDPVYAKDIQGWRETSAYPQARSWQEEDWVAHHAPQVNIRPMHSAPELLQRLPSSIIHPSTFLQVHRTRPTQVTEYLGVFPGQATTPHVSLNKGQREALGGAAVTGTQVLRRIPRSVGVASNAAPHAEVQHRPVYDRVPDVEPVRTMAEHTFLSEAFALQMQMHDAEETYIPASLPEFHYEGADSEQGRQLPPHQSDYP